MLFIISLGTKARAGGVFSQREFIVSTISALVHHHSWCHLGKKPDCLLFCNERKRHIYGFSGALIFHGIFFHSSSILIISNREAALSLPLSNYCDAFYWLLSLPLWSIWHLIEGRSPLIKGTSTTGSDGNLFYHSSFICYFIPLPLWSISILGKKLKFQVSRTTLRYISSGPMWAQSAKRKGAFSQKQPDEKFQRKHFLGIFVLWLLVGHCWDKDQNHKDT